MEMDDTDRPQDRDKPTRGRSLRITARTIRVIARSLLHALVGAAVVLIVAFVVHLERRPDLAVWHTVDLDEEFTADKGVADFDAYLELEQRLFAQLDELVYEAQDAAPAGELLRYHRGSLADPGSRPTESRPRRS